MNIYDIKNTYLRRAALVAFVPFGYVLLGAALVAQCVVDAAREFSDCATDCGFYFTDFHRRAANCWARR